MRPRITDSGRISTTVGMPVTQKGCAPGSRRRGVVSAALLGVLLAGCDAAPPRAERIAAQQDAISDARFAALVERVSEPGGFFDTDNLISNETGYLNVIGALGRSGLRGGAYVGVGPDQNYSYIAELRPDIAFITDVRRDNLLHHLLLKALIERSPTRVEFLSALHGVDPPADPSAWRTRSGEEIVAHVDEGRVDRAQVTAMQEALREEIDGFGVPLSDDDHATIRRFHQAFVDAGLSLRFTTFGRPPRPYYPTYRQLVLATDVEGNPASYLASSERYTVVRALHIANRIVPVVGDIAGPSAIHDIGSVLREGGLELTAFYVSNVEFYLWQGRSFERWRENLAALPAHDGAVIIRSYFPNSGRVHPSAVRGSYATQTLQPVSVLLDGDFPSYWEVVTRGVLPLR